MPPEATIVCRFTVALRGANRANVMTAMIAAPVIQTKFASPGREKLTSRPAGSIASRNDPRARNRQARVSIQRLLHSDCRNRGGSGNASGDGFHEYIVRSLHYTKQTDRKYK